MPISTKDKVALVYRGIDHSSAVNTDLRANIEDSDDYYFGRRPAPPASASGRSAAVSLEIQNTVTGLEADMVPAFAFSQPARFIPTGDQDEPQAELESVAVQSELEAIGGYGIILTAIDSALRYKNCVAKVWVEDVQQTRTQLLPDATDQDAAAIVAALEAAGVSKVEVNAATDGGLMISATSGEQRLKVQVIDVARLRYQRDWPSMDIENIPFIAIEHEHQRWELIDMGFPKAIVNKLPKGKNDELSNEQSVSSKLVGEERAYDDAADPALDRITWFECWQRVPHDGSATLERICVSNRELLSDDPVSFINLAIGAAFIQGHRFQGISIYDKLKPIQDSVSQIQRDWEDNTHANNNTKALVWDVMIEDIQAGRVDGAVRAESPNAVYQPIPVIDTSAGNMMFLEYLRRKRAESAGASLDMQSTDSELMKSQVGAVNANQLISHQEQISAFVATNIGQTFIRSLFLTIHRVLREQWRGQLMVRRQGTYEAVKPSEWPQRERVVMTAGMSASERNRKAANLRQVIQDQLALIQAGAPIADLSGVHAAIQDWGLAVGLPVTGYFTDPGSPQGQQMAQGAQRQAQQAQQLQMRLTQFQMQMEQADRTLKAAEVQIKEQANTIDVFKAILDAETSDADRAATAASQAETQLERAGSQGQAGNQAA